MATPRILVKRTEFNEPEPWSKSQRYTTDTFYQWKQNKIHEYEKGDVLYITPDGMCKWEVVKVEYYD